MKKQLDEEFVKLNRELAELEKAYQNFRKGKIYHTRKFLILEKLRRLERNYKKLCNSLKQGSYLEISFTSDGKNQVVQYNTTDVSLATRQLELDLKCAYFINNITQRDFGVIKSKQS